MDLRMSDMLELTLVAIKARPCRRIVATCGLLMAPVHVRLLKSLSVASSTQSLLDKFARGWSPSIAGKHVSVTYMAYGGE